MRLQQVKPKEYKKLGVRRPEQESKNTECHSLPAPGSTSPPFCPVSGDTMAAALHYTNFNVWTVLPPITAWSCSHTLGFSGKRLWLT